MKASDCPKCSYTAGIMCQMCPECHAKWEAGAEERIKARHAQPVTEEEIKRLQGIELAAERVYRNRTKFHSDDSTELYSMILGLGRALKVNLPDRASRAEKEGVG